MGYAAAAMGDWQHFSIDVKVDEKINLSEQLTLELYTVNEGNGAEQNKVQVPLRAVQAEK